MAVTTKYFSTTVSGIGFITHEDQEQTGLSFEIMVQQDGINYVKVTGEEANITTWATRVSGTEVNEVDVQAVIASIPPSPEEKRLRDIELTLADLLAGVI